MVDSVMSETKFTPGRWSVSIDDDGEYAITKDGSFITCAFPTELGFEEGTAEANANLIASAPELYETLKQAASHIKSIIEGEEWGAIEEVLDDCNAALAKARGES